MDPPPPRMHPPAAIHQARFFPGAASAAASAAASSAPSPYPAAASSSSSSAMVDAAGHSTSGPRALQVVWQGRWGADESDPGTGATPMDVEGASTVPAAAAAPTDPRMHSRHKQLRASSLRELTQIIQQEFPTSPDRPLQLTDEQHAPIQSEADFAALRAGAVVLVFDSSDRRTRFTWESSFDHTPHPSTVTYSQELIGMATRSPSKVFAHALAEFVDNSISALRKQQKQQGPGQGRSIPQHHGQARSLPHQAGEICVSFLEQGRAGGKKHFTVVVSDNGCGMDQSMVKAFCRMGDAPQYRNEGREDTKSDAPNNFLNVNISQWGVGAKSAGFYIGDCIVVTSRQAALDQVLQCSLSQKKMFRDHQKSGNAFSDLLVHRPVGDVTEATKGAPAVKVWHPYLEYLIAQERSNPHFTRIAVTGLEERHILELSSPDVDVIAVIARELANIYNRFLHGPMGRNCGNANDDKVWLEPTITVEHVMEDAASANRWRRVYKRNLKDENENETSIYQLRHRGPIFRFRMEVDAPSANSHSSEAGVGGKAIINGELYYLPRGVDGESHPVLRAKADERRERGEAALPPQPLPGGKSTRSAGGKTAASLVPTRHAVEAGSAAASAASAAASSAATPLLRAPDVLDAEGNLIEESPTPIFDLYWHGRLIPFASINLLPFMKFTPETRDCKDRLHGALFFSFPFLTSRNKLTMAQRDLEGYLSEKLIKDMSAIVPLDDRGLMSAAVMPRGHNITNTWNKCRAVWKALDVNYEFKPENKLDAESRAEGKSLFSKVNFAGELIDELVAGKIYKLRDPDAKSPTVFWIKAVYFEQETSTGQGGGKVLVPADSSYGSLGQIWGLQMPRGAHTDKLVRKPLRFVDKSTPLDEQRQEYAKHCELNMSKQPKEIEVWLEPRTMLPPGTTSFRKAAGWAFPACAVAVYGYPVDGVAQPLGGAIKDRERVQCVITRVVDDEWLAPELAAAKAKASAAAAKAQSRNVHGKSLRNAKKTEKGAAAAAAAAARPIKKARHGLPAAAAAAAADTESDEESAGSEEERTDILFRQDALCMSREVALRVKAGELVDTTRKSNEVAAAAAAASSSASGKKRKGAASEGVLGREGFVKFDFGKKCGHYRVRFGLEEWILEGHLLKRGHVAPVHADVVLLPALPARIIVSCHPATLDMGLGVKLEESATSHQHSPPAIALKLIDQYLNEWNRTTLRGETARCGARVASMNAIIIESIDDASAATPAGPPPTLLTTFDPQLAYDSKLHHWFVRQFSITLPHDQRLPFATAASRIEVRVTMKFDVETQYAFDPALTAAELAKLRNLECNFTVRLGPGKPESFVYDNSFGDSRSLVNGDMLDGLSLYVEDGWGHRTTTDSNGMQMCLSSSCTELVPHQPFQSFNAAGELKFAPMRIQIPPELFQRRCTWSEATGQMTVQVQLGVEFVSSPEDAVLATSALKAAAASPPESKSDSEVVDVDAPENPMTNVKQMTLLIRPRWGPVRMMLMPDGAHLLRSADDKAPPELLSTDPSARITLEGEAGQPMPSLHIAFLQESGQFLSVEAIRDGIGSRRRKQLHFYVNSLVEAEGAAADSSTRSATSFTLDDLDPSGRLVGLALPQVLLASHAEPELSPRNDGSMLCRAEIVMKVIEGAKMEDEEAADDPDVMIDEARSSATIHAKAELRAKLEAAPSLSSLMPVSTLSAPFFLRVRACAPVRWHMSQSFPRGFKCGLTWQEFVRIGLVDRFGNACSIPDGVGENNITVQFIDSTQPQQNALTASSADAGTNSVVSMDLDGASNSSLIPVSAPVSVAATISAGASTSGAPAAGFASSTENPLRKLGFSRPLLADNTLAPYFVAKEAFLVAKAGTHALVARDLANRFAASESMPIHLISGLACSIRAYSDPESTQKLGYACTRGIGVREGATSIRVASKGKVGRIFVRFYDRGDNETVQPANLAVQLTLDTGHGDNKPKPEDVAAAATATAQAAAMPMEVEGAAAQAPTSVAAIASAGPAAAAPMTAECDAATSSSAAAAASLLDSSDATVSGVYPYPITCDTLQSGRAVPAKGTKEEYTPLTHLTGMLKTYPTSADATTTGQYSLIEEFTLHLHRAHWATSSLVITGRDLVAKRNATIRNTIVIPLDVKPFLSAVQTVALQAKYDASAMEAALQAKPDSLTLQAPLLMPPSFAAASMPQLSTSLSAAAAAVVSTTLPAVPAGTPFPSIFVDLLMEGSEVTGLSASTIAPAGDAAASCSAAGGADATSEQPVKLESELEADSTGSVRSSMWLAGFLLPGLSIEVVWRDGDRSEKQGFVYKKPFWDATHRRFVFAPTSLSDVAGGGSTAAPSSFHAEDYCLNHAGEWLFLVRYLEPRPDVQAVLLQSQWERVAKISQPVTHGQPHKLRIALDTLEPNIVVCNGELASAQTRCLAAKLALELVDAFDQTVQLSALSEESLQALRSVQWKIEPAQKTPSPASSVARSSRPPTTAVIDLLDSDTDEDTNMQDAAPAASSAAAASSSAPAAAAAAPAPARVPPSLSVSPPVLDLVHNRFDFPTAITIVPNCAGDSGRYSLSFFLPPPFSSPLLRADLSFQFSNSARDMQLLQEAARVKNAQLKAAKDQYLTKRNQITQQQQTAKQLEDEHARIAAQQHKQIEQLQRVCAELKQHDLDPPLSVPSTHMLAYCADWLAHKRAELQRVAGDAANRTAESIPVRLPSIRTQASSPASRLTKAQGFHGCLVELAYVEDFKINALISWYLQGYLSCLITSDRGCVADRELRQWCKEKKMGAVIDLKLVNKQRLSPMLPHLSIRYDAGVAAAARAAGIPAPPPVPFDPRTVRGTPRYLLSHLRFNSDNPAERDQYMFLFASLAGGTIILDNMTDAAAYRTLLINNNIKCPNLLALRELKQLAANNIERFDEGATAGGLDRLAAYFQVKPAPTNPRQRALEQLQAVEAAVSRVDDLKSEYDECARAITDLHYEQRSSAHKRSLAALCTELEEIRNEANRLGGSIARESIAVAASSSSSSSSASPALRSHQSAGVNDRREANARSIDERQRATQAAASAASHHAATSAAAASGRAQFFPSAPAALSSFSSRGSARH